MRFLGLVMALLAWAVIGAWLTGRVLSDRWWLTQWLLWIPTPVALLAAGTGLLAALRPTTKRRARRRRLAVWGSVMIALGAYFGIIEHRFLRSKPDPPAGLKLAHWTISETMGPDVEPFVDGVTSIDADVTILTNAGGAPWHPDVRAWLGGREGVQSIRPFAVLTKLPVLEKRWLAQQDDVALVLLIIDARTVLGRDLVMYLIDMPSDPKRSRATTASRARQLIESADAPPPDVIVGDFNMTRGSAALRSIAPEMRHAFEEGGHGYGATYHQCFPLYHIDHVLLRDPLRCVRYDVPAVRIGRHRPQVTWIVNVDR
jgi:hypothetical protein